MEYTGWDNYVKEQYLKDFNANGERGVWEPDDYRFARINARLYAIEEFLEQTNLTDRVIDLERQSVGFANAHNADHNEVVNRVKALESWQNRSVELVNIEHENRIKDLELSDKIVIGDLNELLKRIREVEEWKRTLDDKLKNPFRGYYTSIDCRQDKMFQDKKMIDKKVWEDIKSEATKLNIDFDLGNHFVALRSRFDSLRDAIKKAEGDKD